MGDGFPGTEVGADICPGKTGDGEFEDGPEGEVIGFTLGLFLSNLKYNRMINKEYHRD